MTDPTQLKPVPKSGAIPPWIGFMSIGMFCVGCLFAALSYGVKDVNSQKITLLAGAVSFIPLGALGMANGYTASVRADLLNRIEELETRLRNRS